MRMLVAPDRRTLRLAQATGLLGRRAKERLHRTLKIALVESSRKKKGETRWNRAKDQIKGYFHELKGNVKETAGQVTNNSTLETEGQNEKLTGKVQKRVGQIEEVLDK
jgi:uncharacterized protein YjbJ (UPF0337 family)